MLLEIKKRKNKNSTLFNNNDGIKQSPASSYLYKVKSSCQIICVERYSMLPFRQLHLFFKNRPAGCINNFYLSKTGSI